MNLDHALEPVGENIIIVGLEFFDRPTERLHVDRKQMLKTMFTHSAVQFFLFFRNRAGIFPDHEAEMGTVTVEASAFFIRHVLDELCFHGIDAFLHSLELFLKFQFLISQRLQGVRCGEHAFFTHIVILR